MAVTALPSVKANVEATVKQLFGYITAQGDADYLGENVSQLQHTLQAATLAQKAGADEETILGALLHDVGRFIPASEKTAAMTAPDGTYVGKASHEVAGEQYLRYLGFSEKICQLVGAHVMAKRYLTAVDSAYYDGLSQPSKKSLKLQGGPFDEEQVKAAKEDPLLENKLAVRRWDDLAKDPNKQTPPLSEYTDMTVESLLKSRSSIELHGRKYRLPTVPSVVVCVDGFDPEYLDHAIADGIVPNLARFRQQGFHAPAKCAMPSLTNPNNVSIVTGSPVSVHGILGNYFLDRETGQEEMITDDTLLRGSTILELMSKRGVRVAAVTAKDKLRAILAHGLDNAICFSAQKASECSIKANGIENVEAWLGQSQPSQYSGELSLFVLDAGIKLLQEDRADLFYLTLSDFIQHKYGPGSKESNDFLTKLDERLGALVELGAQVAVTGDHGMSEKCKADGTPNVLFLEDAIVKKFGPGTARVICPISDPFVKHHGALGGFVRVYLLKHADQKEEVVRYCRTLLQVETALDSREAAKVFELALDREGDIVVISKKNAVIGSREDEHDLSNLGDHRLRSHGGLSEQDIPLLMSRAVNGAADGTARQWRNFDAFDLLLNH